MTEKCKRHDLLPGECLDEEMLNSPCTCKKPALCSGSCGHNQNFFKWQEDLCQDFCWLKDVLTTLGIQHKTWLATEAIFHPDCYTYDEDGNTVATLKVMSLDVGGTRFYFEEEEETGKFLGWVDMECCTWHPRKEGLER